MSLRIIRLCRRSLLWALMLSLWGCASLVPLNMPAPALKNPHEAGNYFMALLNENNPVKLLSHFSPSNPDVFSSTGSRLLAVKMLERYLETCEKGAFFTGLQEEVNPRAARMHFLCYGEQAEFLFELSFAEERGGYVLTNVDNLSAGYSFAELAQVFGSNAPAQQQRIDLLKPLINAKSCEDLAPYQSSGAVPPQYADQSLLFARVSQLSCLEQFKDTDVERLWLKETLVHPYGRVWLAASYLYIQKRWQEEEPFLALAFDRYQGDWIFHAAAFELKLALGKKEEALYHATQAFVLSPYPLVGTILLANALVKSGNEEAARKMLPLMKLQKGDLLPEDFREDMPELARVITQSLRTNP